MFLLVCFALLVFGELQGSQTPCPASSLLLCRFRRQHKIKYGEKGKYSRTFCEELVEDLDRMAHDLYRDGKWSQALKAFEHSLRVRTRTNIDFNLKSTAKTIHCMGDVYAKQGNWEQARKAYSDSSNALRKYGQEDDDEIRRWLASLKRKQGAMKTRIQISRIVGL